MEKFAMPSKEELEWAKHEREQRNDDPAYVSTDEMRAAKDAHAPKAPTKKKDDRAARAGYVLRRTIEALAGTAGKIGDTSAQMIEANKKNKEKREKFDKEYEEFIKNGW